MEHNAQELEGALANDLLVIMQEKTEEKRLSPLPDCVISRRILPYVLALFSTRNEFHSIVLLRRSVDR